MAHSNIIVVISLLISSPKLHTLMPLPDVSGNWLLVLVLKFKNLPLMMVFRKKIVSGG